MALVVQIVTTKDTRVAARCPRCSRVLVTGAPAGTFEVTCKLCTARVQVSDLPPTAAAHGLAQIEGARHAFSRRI